MVSFLSGSMGQFSCGTTTSSKPTFGGDRSLPKPIVTPYSPPISPLSSPSSSPPSSASTTWRCRSSISSPSSSSSPPSPPLSHSSTSTTWRRRSSASSSDWETSCNWRTGNPRLPTRALPRYEDAQPGDVLFLPLQLPPSDSIIFEKLALSAEQRPWGHPAVITGKFMEAGKECVRIRLCTTFGGRKIEDVKPVWRWKMFALAENEQDEKPQEGTRLVKMAVGSGNFQKRSYVNLSKNAEYPIEFVHLDCWTGRVPLKFDSESTQRIINCECR
ncbi:hypothetical protein BKA66DRAFT_571079 [Pyrenochaeta sp. MPI-SDFR-AT-0127]|nr:hypothetical protein BKA66DRAFT_571079 [Pyrenochaeta sp. MPI-SDFR-AT-0127]